jgi:hypothetical protein
MDRKWRGPIAGGATVERSDQGGGEQSRQRGVIAGGATLELSDCRWRGALAGGGEQSQVEWSACWWRRALQFDS